NTQGVVTQEGICTAFSKGKRHDFRGFKESKTHIHPKIKGITDTGYQGLKTLHSRTDIPKKKGKKNPLTQEEKRKNRKLSSERVMNENGIGMLKRFKIISDTYRNRRNRFGLRFTLIAGVYTMELEQ
ncbi:transposase family protein, partial [Holospora curviuscula]|uniref:transposase family protein n=1 Tax=Holospora curviuscula TaxID=1082868 RepID=UPI0013FD8186